MAKVTGMTAEKIVEITDDAVVSATIDATTSILTLHTRGGEGISAGVVGGGEKAITDTLKRAYPVGSIFFSAVATNPGTLLGVGTWVAWGTGRMPVGVDPAQTEFSTVEKTGGAKTHTILLTEVPKHAHSGAPHTHPIDHDHPSVTTSSDTHSHNLSLEYSESGSGSFPRVSDIADTTGGGGTNATAQTWNDTHNHTVDVPTFVGSSGAATAGTTGSAGGNTDGTTQPFSTLPPYITCYMWKRTA